MKMETTINIVDNNDDIGAKGRKNYKKTIKKILTQPEAAAGLRLEKIHNTIEKQFGQPLSQTGKSFILTAINSLKESNEIFEVTLTDEQKKHNPNNPKFRLVDHPQFKGLPAAAKSGSKSKKLDPLSGDLHFELTCVCGHHHVQYLSEKDVQLGVSASFRCSCGWQTTFQKA